MNYSHCIFLKLVENLLVKIKRIEGEKKKGKGKRDEWRKEGKEGKISGGKEGKKRIFERLNIKTPFLESKR